MSDEFTAGGCNPSDCASCGGGCSSVGGCDPIENHKTITLTMEDDTEVECAILTVFPVDAKEYIALLPLDENGQNESGDSLPATGCPGQNWWCARHRPRIKSICSRCSQIGRAHV